jgi:hypothetical protein
MVHLTKWLEILKKPIAALGGKIDEDLQADLQLAITNNRLKDISKLINIGAKVDLEIFKLALANSNVQEFELILDNLNVTQYHISLTLLIDIDDFLICEKLLLMILIVKQ